MHTLTHTTASGDELTLQLTDDELAFYRRVRAMCDDPSKNAGDVIDLVWSDQNPILAPSPIPGRGYVTAAVYARPAYRAFDDLAWIKQVHDRTVTQPDLSFDLTVADAAARLGISEGAVRKAMTAGRLPRQKRKNKLYTTSAAVAAFVPSARGPQSSKRARKGAEGALRVVWGSAPGLSFAVVSDGQLVEESREGQVRTGRLEGWTWAFVKSKRQGNARGWMVTPGGTTEQVTNDPFGVWGAVTVAENYRDGRVTAAWGAARDRAREAGGTV